MSNQVSQTKINRGELARQILENPIYKEPFLMIRSILVERMSKVKPTSADELQEIARTFQNLDKIEKVFETIYKTGKAEANKSKFGFSKNNVI